MTNKQMLAIGAAGMFVGFLLIAEKSSTFGTGAGTVLFCYGLWLWCLTAFNKIMGKDGY